MELDFEIIIYIIFLAIALLSRLLGKKKKTPQKPREVNKDTELEPTSMTFDDLLKELTGKSEEKRSQAPPLVREEEKETARDFDFKDPIASDDEIKEIYEKSVADASRGPEIDRPKFSAFEEYKEEKRENPFTADIKSMLKDKNSLKKAT